MRKARVLFLVMAALVLSCAQRETPSSPTQTKVEVRPAAAVPQPGYAGMVMEESGESLYVSADVVLSNEDIARARAIKDGSGLPAVEIELTPEGRQTFADFTGGHIGERAAILLDGRVTSAPVIRDTIGGGKAVITGRFTEEEVERLAASLTPSN